MIASLVPLPCGPALSPLRYHCECARWNFCGRSGTNEQPRQSRPGRAPGEARAHVRERTQPLADSSGPCGRNVGEHGAEMPPSACALLAPPLPPTAIRPARPRTSAPLLGWGDVRLGSGGPPSASAHVRRAAHRSDLGIDITTPASSNRGGRTISQRLRRQTRLGRGRSTPHGGAACAQRPALHCARNPNARAPPGPEE